MKAKEFRLTANESEFDMVAIRNERQAAQYARQFYLDDICIYESSFVILLNGSSRTMGWVKLSQGGLDSTTMDKRMILKVALDTLASGIILVHNHPSGSCTPSKADIEETGKLRTYLNTFEIELLDHIILTENEHYSFHTAKVHKG